MISSDAIVALVDFSQLVSFTGAPNDTVHSVGLTDLTLSCAAGSACRSRRGTPVAAHDVRRTESRSATGVTPARLR